MYRIINKYSIGQEQPHYSRGMDYGRGKEERWGGHRMRGKGHSRGTDDDGGGGLYIVCPGQMPGAAP